jgi:hypothetical protein
MSRKGWDRNLTAVWVCSSCIFIVLSTCTVFLFRDDRRQLAITVICCTFSLMVGWLLGTFVSPYEDETKTFSNLWKVISGLVSGAILTKLYDATSKVLSGEHPLTPQQKVRLLLCVTWGTLSLAHTFLNRHYSARLQGNNLVGINPALLEDIQKKVTDVHKATVPNQQES